jgi:sporulation protein YlmC with PRC-barrel domain
MEAFVETEFIKVDIPHYTDAGFGWPYVRTTYEEQRKPVQHMHIPLHTRELRRGTPVMALDGRVGRVDELIVGPRNKHITHIVVHQGHLFNQKDTVIPLGAIESIEDELILLNLDQKGVEALPLVPIHRHFTPVAI